MNGEISRIEKLIAETDRIEYRSPTCSYTGCLETPISSHTLAENLLSKLNQDLRKVLTCQTRVLQIFKKPEASRMIRVSKEEFSTFEGFCAKHDGEIFPSIDVFDGNLTSQKGALIYYRNICYGVHHIHAQIKKLAHIAKQNFTQDEVNEVGEKAYSFLRNGAFLRRLNFCLNEHERRKVCIEKMIQANDFRELEGFELIGPLENPIFYGRSNYFLHKKEPLFQVSGYDYMPWITYATLLSGPENHLIFCWLKSDKKHARHLKAIVRNPEFKKCIEALAYVKSDAFAVDEIFYEKNSHSINEYVRFRLL